MTTTTTLIARLFFWLLIEPFLLRYLLHLLLLISTSTVTVAFAINRSRTIDSVAVAAV